MNTKKDFNGALVDLSKAITLFPNEYIAYKNRAELKILMNDKKGAISDLHFCIRLNGKLKEQLQPVIDSLK